MSTSFDGECEVWREHERVARKEHTCKACGETIRPGDRYTFTSWIFDGYPGHSHKCQRCQLIYMHLLTVSRDEVSAHLDCGHTYEEIFDTAPPPAIAALAFALPGEVGAIGTEQDLKDAKPDS